MAEQRLIDANETKRRIIAFATGCHSEALTVESIIMLLNQSDTVDAVVLPRKPRPLMRDSNTNNTDVYCPECGTNLSGYYGECSLPFVPCFNCGAILDTHKATTRMDGGMENAEL